MLKNVKQKDSIDQQNKPVDKQQNLQDQLFCVYYKEGLKGVISSVIADLSGIQKQLHGTQLFVLIAGK